MSIMDMSEYERAKAKRDDRELEAEIELKKKALDNKHKRRSEALSMLRDSGPYIVMAVFIAMVVGGVMLIFQYRDNLYEDNVTRYNGIVECLEEINPNYLTSRQETVLVMGCYEEWRQ